MQSEEFGICSPEQQNRGEKSYDDLNKYRKIIWQNGIYMYKKNLK